jgi:hypothetical protein
VRGDRGGLVAEGFPVFLAFIEPFVRADQILYGGDSRRTQLLDQPTIDPVRPKWPSVDEAGVCLNEGRAGADSFPSVGRRLDAADRYEDESPLCSRM